MKMNFNEIANIANVTKNVIESKLIYRHETLYVAIEFSIDDNNTDLYDAMSQYHEDNDYDMIDINNSFIDEFKLNENFKINIDSETARVIMYNIFDYELYKFNRKFRIVETYDNIHDDESYYV